MLYLDANVFVYAALNSAGFGEKAAALLQKVQCGEEEAATSALTYDEVFWAIKRHDLELAFEVCEALLNFPHLGIIPADSSLAISALRLVREYRLDPRDAMHAATAIAKEADCIVSTDDDFDKVKMLKRQSL